MLWFITNLSIFPSSIRMLYIIIFINIWYSLEHYIGYVASDLVQLLGVEYCINSNQYKLSVV